MKYIVTIGDRRHEVVVDGAGVTVGGRTRHAELRVVSGTPLRHLLLDGVSYVLPVESRGNGVCHLQDHGTSVEVEVLDERAAHIRSLVGGTKNLAGGGVVKAPMPGLVVRVLVEPGQRVAAGAGLIVLEAMKMENELKAIAPGIVQTITAKPGQAVEKGTVLVTFAP